MDNCICVSTSTAITCMWSIFGSQFSPLNSGHEVWQQAPLPAGPSCWPLPLHILNNC